MRCLNERSAQIEESISDNPCLPSRFGPKPSRCMRVASLLLQRVLDEARKQRKAHVCINVAALLRPPGAES
jgi:hypothetical protein